MAFTADALSSPINVKIIAPRTKLDPLDLINHIYLGSGVVINENTILTAFHNIEWPTAGCGSWATNVKVLAYAPKEDICIIEYPTEGQKYSRLAPGPPKVGDRVVLNGRRGIYYGTWVTNPHSDDVMSIDFDSRRPKIGDSGGGVYSEAGLVGIFLGYTGWIDSPEGEASYVCPWKVLKAFGIPVSGTSAPVKSKLIILPLPGTEDGKTSTQSGTKEEEEEKEPIKAKKPIIIGSTLKEDTERVKKQGTVPSTAGLSDSQGASLLPTPSKSGSTITPKGDDMMEMLIAAALGVAGITMTGGTGAVVYFGAKGLVTLYRRRKKRRSDTNINSLAEQLEEVLGRETSPSKFHLPHIPGRKVDEIGEILQLAELEGYDPLMGSTFGLFMQDEINQLLSGEAPEEQKDIVRKLYNSTMDRLNSAAPLVKGQ